MYYTHSQLTVRKLKVFLVLLFTQNGIVTALVTATLTELHLCHCLQDQAFTEQRGVPGSVASHTQPSENESISVFK